MTKDKNIHYHLYLCYIWINCSCLLIFFELVYCLDHVLLSLSFYCLALVLFLTCSALSCSSLTLHVLISWYLLCLLYSKYYCQAPLFIIEKESTIQYPEYRVWGSFCPGLLFYYQQYIKVHCVHLFVVQKYSMVWDVF